jgi:large conductance mechanosensitive channel
MLNEFKTFISKGNVVDLAVGVIIGGAFGKIVSSMVEDIITPIIGLFGGQPDFSSIVLYGIRIGSFINALIAFLILAAVIFLVFVKPMNKLKSMAEKPAAPAAPPEPSAEEKLLAEIRDLLKQQA